MVHSPLKSLILSLSFNASYGHLLLWEMNTPWRCSSLTNSTPVSLIPTIQPQWMTNIPWPHLQFTATNSSDKPHSWASPILSIHPTPTTLYHEPHPIAEPLIILKLPTFSKVLHQFLNINLTQFFCPFQTNSVSQVVTFKMRSFI